MTSRSAGGRHGEPGPAQTGGGLTPFVNRIEERRLLRDRFEQAREGAGQVVLLTGEAGIGKSRLVQALREDIADVPHTWLEASGEPEFAETPFYTWARLLRQLLGWEADRNAPAGNLDALTEALRQAGLDPRRAIPQIAPVVGAPVPEGYPPLLATPAAARKQLLATLTALVVGTARRQPLVILLENMDWVDPSTVELQDVLVQQGATESLLLLYTARPQFQVPWPVREHHTQLTVNRLLRRHARDMVLGVAARSEMLADLIEQLAARTDGVPLFVEELTKAVIEGGSAAALHAIPATLAESLTARLDRLDAATREVAQVAAVCGREFRYDLLDAVHPVGSTTLEVALRELLDAELVHVRGFGAEATYTFKHALVQDTASSSLPEARRRAVHGQVAAALLARCPDLVGAHPELLAQHHMEAGEIEPAVAAWQRAGEQATQRGAVSEAERLLRRALDLLPRWAEGPDRDARELQLQLALGRVLLQTRGYGAPECVAAYARARTVGARVADPDQLVALMNGAFILSLMREGPTAARPLADELMNAAERSGSPWWLGMGHLALAVTSFHEGDFARAWEQAERARASCDAPPLFPVPIDPTIMALGYGAYAGAHLGRLEEARARAAEAAARAAASARPSDKGLAHQFLSIFHANLIGDLTAASADVEQILAACAQQPNQFQEAFARMMKGWLVALQGQPQAGLSALRPALIAVVATGQRLGLGFALGLLADAYALAGQTAEALNALDECESAVPGDVYLRPVQLCRRAELRARAGADPAEVEATYRDAIACAHTLGSRPFELRSAASYADWLRHRDRPAEARAILAPICARLDERFDTLDARRARAILRELESPAAAASPDEVLAAPRI